jgi:hypothetical protein
MTVATDPKPIYVLIGMRGVNFYGKTGYKGR